MVSSMIGKYSSISNPLLDDRRPIDPHRDPKGLSKLHTKCAGTLRGSQTPAQSPLEDLIIGHTLLRFHLKEQ